LEEEEEEEEEEAVIAEARLFSDAPLVEQLSMQQAMQQSS
jgi:hypothetical protein